MHADQELEVAHHHDPEEKPLRGQVALIDREERETGGVSFQVYKKYATYAGGWKTLAGGLFAMLLFLVFSALVNIICAEWTSDSPQN
jgi:hypothetical protein